MPAVASFVPGEWTDVVLHPDGYAQVALERPGVMVAYINGREVWRIGTGWGLYLRATVINGRVWAAMQRADGRLVVTDGVATDDTRGDVFGQNGVAWNGARLYVLRSATTSEEFDYSTGAFRPFTHRETSQGFFDPAGGIFWTDDAFANVPGMTLGFTRGALALGQSQIALQLRLRYNGAYSIAYEGIAYEPRLVQLGPTTWVGSARTPRGALFLTLTPPFPPEIPSEPEVNPPGVTIDHFDPVVRPNQPWRVEFHDRNNEGFSGVVEFVNGSVHVRITNPVDTDRSGSRRAVAVLP
jgi:hypothetical protein